MLGLKFNLWYGRSSLFPEDPKPAQYLSEYEQLFYHYLSVMIPSLVSLPKVRYKVLPIGIHETTLLEVQNVYSYNPVRLNLFNGFVRGAKALAYAGCKTIFLNGSYVTSKEIPGDFDACWDPEGIEIRRLDPVFLELDPPRDKQKAKFYGEFLHTRLIETSTEMNFVEFFQRLPYNENLKGILRIDTTEDPWLRGPLQ